MIIDEQLYEDDSLTDEQYEEASTKTLRKMAGLE